MQLSKTILQKCRGIIVWDFDRVLFDTERFYAGAKIIFKKYGVSHQLFWKAILKIRREGDPFSLARMLRILRAWNIVLPEKRIRQEVHRHLSLTDYFTCNGDVVLHRLRKLGFVHIVLNYGVPAYLRKRVQCRLGGERFSRHFVKIIVTRRPKYLFLKKFCRRYPWLPLFFVDDAVSHIKLVKKYIPNIVTIHYTQGWSLEKVKQIILAAGRGKHGEIRQK